LAGYTIKRGVGRGGFGEVYYAVSDAGKEVALKLIRRNLDVELRGVTQCLNLKHPNLVALYDIRTDDNDDRWVVMEYVSGESLEDAINRHPNGMPIELVLQWFFGIAAGVAYLHDHGIVHRDLKPANIFLDEDTVKIGDYGLSKFISCSRRSGQTESVGTVHYMAPEIANGRYGREIDTYALGIILYEMLSGHVPFEGESVGEVLMKHLTAEPDLHAINEPYRSVVAGAMAKDPETRIRNAAAMLEALNLSAPPSGTFSMSAGGMGGEPSTCASPASPMAKPLPAAALPVEPLEAAVKKGWGEFRTRFRESSMHPLLKSVLGVAAAIFLLATSPEWLSIGIVCGVGYIIYRVFWTLVIQPVQPAVGQAAQVAASAPAMAPAAGADASPKKGNKRVRRMSWQRQLREHAATKPTRERLIELTGGMLLAVLIAVVGSLLVCLIGAEPFDLSLFVWMAAVCALGCWGIMIPTRLAEGRIEDQAPMRFIQLISGAVVGILAWLIADWLMVPKALWNNNFGISLHESLMGNTLGLGGWNTETSQYADSTLTQFGQIPLQVYAAYFAFLFVLIAWWEQAESTRRARVSVWSILWCGFLAWLLHFIWWFPQPLGTLLAGLMAFSLQFASPWISPSRRRAITGQGG
jgi:hypothetical protein